MEKISLAQRSAETQEWHLAELYFRAGCREALAWVREHSRAWESLSFNDQADKKETTSMLTMEIDMLHGKLGWRNGG